MPQAVPGLPTPRAQAAPGAARPGGAPVLVLSLLVPRTTSGGDTLATAARDVLLAFGVPPALAQKTSDAARIAVHFVVGHSRAPVIRLLLTADKQGVTVAVTDYVAPEFAGTPAWQPAARRQAKGAGPGAARPEPADGASHGLLLHRSPDGHIHLSYRAPWDSVPPPA